MTAHDFKDDERLDPDGRVTTERHGFLLLIGIDRQAKLNSFTPKMHRELQAAFVALDESDDLRAGIVFGHGQHFTAGLDLPKFVSYAREGSSALDFAQVDPWSRWKVCRKPVICAVKGIAYTAGVELMLGSDIVIAASDCRFSQLEPKWGIMPTGGAVHRFIARGGWGNAMYHLLTGQEFGAVEAYRIGLVQEIVDPGQELERAIALGERIAANAPLAIQAIKANGLTSLREGEEAALAALAPAQKALLTSEDAAEGLRGFIERRPPIFCGK